ncbi:hypothetical protein FHETE_6766 [Fusarium heterosporum]|uniref:Uncharacterized protein n=1 Tax=Fusarium heterosporum TaxID=42747 RepID=A0A8H5WNG9_FUSHE|nr:hypothetical protein FHETE_6766 [Fusarium heterosporum]
MTLPLLTISKNTTLEERDPWSLFEDRRDGIFAWSILGFIFIFMLGLVIRDMCAKYRTGVLADEAKDCKELLILLVKMPFMLFTKHNLKSSCNWFTNLFRSAEHKRVIKKQAPTGLVLEEILDSDKIVKKLGGGSTSAPSSKEEEEPEQEGVRKIPGFDPNKFNVKRDGTRIPPVKLVSNLLDIHAVIPSLGDKDKKTTDSTAPTSVPTPGPSLSDSPSLSLSFSLGLLEVERERERPNVTGDESSTLVASTSIPATLYQSHGSDSSPLAQDQGDDSVTPAQGDDSVPPAHIQVNAFIPLTQSQANDSASPSHSHSDESTSQSVSHTDINTGDGSDGGDAGGD